MPGIDQVNTENSRKPDLKVSAIIGAGRYWPIWAAVLPLAGWALVRALGLESGGVLTTAMFFTPYAAVAALLVAGVAVALRNWAAAAVAALAMAYLALAILPRTVGGDTARAGEGGALTVLSANVYLGKADANALVGLVDRYNPDILSVQELTPAFARRLQRAGIGTRLPQAVTMPRPRGSGGGLYARHPLALLPRQTHLFFRMPRAALTLPDGGRLRVVAVHPQPPNMSFDAWEEGLASLPAAGSGIPWLLAGDFNATFDQAEFRDLVDRGYLDAGDATGKGLEPTWQGPPDFPWGFIVLDHVLADRRLGIAEYGVDDLPGSDHQAIHARVALP